MQVCKVVKSRPQKEDNIPTITSVNAALQTVSGAR